MAALPFRIPGRCTVAIDLGTAFLRVANEQSGVVTIPMNMINPPLRGGVIADPLTVAEMLMPSLTKSRRLGILRPRVLVGAPTDAHGAEREALVMALRAAGADDIQIVPEPQASAIGAGLDVSSSHAQMIVDVGEGVTDCAIIREGMIVASHASRVGCGNLRTMVREAVLHRWDLRLSPAEAERIVMAAGVGASSKNTAIPIKANFVDHRRSPTIGSSEVQELLDPIIEEILAASFTLLREAPHALGCEIIESGIVLTGGGALLPGLPKRLAWKTDIHVSTPRDPLGAVVSGLQQMVAISNSPGHGIAKKAR
jgi:rod shape-determining protein MreB and related proteins